MCFFMFFRFLIFENIVYSGMLKYTATALEVGVLIKQSETF